MVALSETAAQAAARLAPLVELLSCDCDGDCEARVCDGGLDAMERAVREATALMGAAPCAVDADTARAASRAGGMVMRRHALAMLRRTRDEGGGSVRLRVLRLLALDAAILAAAHPPCAPPAGRATHGARGTLCACGGVRLWLMRKAADLGLDVMAALVEPAADAACGEEPGDDEGEETADAGDDDDEAVASEEICVPGVGRRLLEMTVLPRTQRLILALLSLEGADLGMPTHKYTFAVGLTTAFLLAAEVVDESGDVQVREFAAWDARRRGPLRLSEQVVPPDSLRALIGFFCTAGATLPLAPREPPPRWLFRAVNPAAPLLGAL